MKHIKNFFGSKKVKETKDITKINMSNAEYTSLNTQRVDNTVYLNDIISELSFISGLVPDHIDRIFGKYCFLFDGGEYRTSCWALKMDDEIFIVVSAKGRGTTVESECVDKQKIITFLNSFIEKMLSTKDEEIEKIHKILYNYPKKKRRF